MTTAKRPYYFATGKRKTALARVRLYEHGAGAVTVNEQPLERFFFGILGEKVLSPLVLTNHRKAFDVSIQVEGGGKSGQADASRHGISRALLRYDPGLRLILKKAGLLRRDSRIRERKKPGLKRARRAPQWQKR